MEQMLYVCSVGMKMILETVVASLAPVGIEAVKQLITKWTGGYKPATIDEQLKLEQAEIERLKAIAELDRPIGSPSQWVVDLRASSRYVGALAVIAAGFSTLFMEGLDAAVIMTALDAAGICFGFLFGQRVLVNMKGRQ